VIVPLDPPTELARGRRPTPLPPSPSVEAASATRRHVRRCAERRAECSVPVNMPLVDYFMSRVSCAYSGCNYDHCQVLY
jgi:hypothetical protein